MKLLSNLDNLDNIEDGENKQSIHFIKIREGSESVIGELKTSTIWSGQDDTIKELYTGLTIAYIIPEEGDPNLGVLLNINNLGHHPVVYGEKTSIGDLYSKQSILILTYDAETIGQGYYNSEDLNDYTGVWKVAAFHSLRGSENLTRIQEVTYEEYKALEEAGKLDSKTEYHILDGEIGEQPDEDNSSVVFMELDVFTQFEEGTSVPPQEFANMFFGDEEHTIDDVADVFHKVLDSNAILYANHPSTPIIPIKTPVEFQAMFKDDSYVFGFRRAFLGTITNGQFFYIGIGSPVSKTDDVNILGMFSFDFRDNGKEIFIGSAEEAPEETKLIITDEYVDYDQFPLGTVIEYNGDVVPDGYKEVDSYSNILVSPTEPTMSNKPDVWVKYSKNLCNPLMFVNDRYQNALTTNTTLSANTNYWVTGLQFCEEGKTYYVNQEFNNCTFFDGNKVMNLNNDYEKGYVPTSKTFTVPTGIKYFQLCFAKSVVKYDTPIIVSEIENLTYEPYVKPEIMIYNEGKYNTFYNKDIYSGEEQRIGTWVDGSPLYQYTVKLTRDVVSSGNQTNYSCPVSGYKNIWMDLSSSFIELSNKTILNFDTYQTSTDYAKVTIGTGDNSIRFLYGDQWRAVSVTLYITLRYTKLIG